jgi:hypothetical protein
MDDCFHFFVDRLAFNYGEHLDFKSGLDVRLIRLWDGKNHHVEALAIDHDIHIAQVGISVFPTPPAS